MDIFRNAFNWGIINNSTQLIFAFVFFILLGELTDIQSFSSYIVILAYTNIAISLFEFRLQDIFLRDADLGFENVSLEYSAFFICEILIRLMAFSLLSFPISLLTGQELYLVYVIGLSVITSKIYTGVSNGFVKKLGNSWKIFLLICCDYISKLLATVYFHDVNLENIMKIYSISFLVVIPSYLLLFNKYIVSITIHQITKPLKRSLKFTKDNWKLSVVETCIRELDIILIEALFNGVIVVTYRYAKLISGSAWRIVDSILQIELLALRERRELFQVKILTINPLYYIVIAIHISALVCVYLLKDWNFAFTRLDNIMSYTLLNTVWTFFGLFHYRDFVYLQHRDRLDIVVMATVYSSLIYFLVIILSYFTYVEILPVSYSICMSLYFIIIGKKRRGLDGI